jgi:transcriptional regulator with XRE-family HTH domain
MKRVRPEFGERVKAELEKRGLSLRAARIRTGIDHVTLSDMAAGYVPRLEQVERFAIGFGLPINEWRLLAGFEPVDPDVSACVRLFVQELTTNPQTALPYAREIAKAARVAEERLGTYDTSPAQPPFPYLIPRQPANSPFYQRAVEGIQAAYAKYQPLGYQMLDPFGTSPHHGWKFQSAEEADRAVLRYLERIALANDDKTEPEELKAARRKDE